MSSQKISNPVSIPNGLQHKDKGTTNVPDLSQSCNELHQVSSSPVSGSKGYFSKLASSLPTNLPDLGLGGYIPEFVKDYAAGGAHHRADMLNRERISWVCFDEVYDEDDSLHVFLLIGYVKGFQVWDVTNPQNIIELFSLRDGPPIKLLKFLKTPGNQESGGISPLSKARPLLAVTSALDTESFPKSVVKIFSVKLQQYAHELRFKTDVYAVKSSSKVVAVSLHDVVYVFSAQTLDHCFGVKCYPSPVINGVLSLGNRWLAYPGGYQVSSNVDEKVEHAESDLRTMSKDLATGLYYLKDLGRSYLVHNNKPLQKGNGQITNQQQTTGEEQTGDATIQQHGPSQTKKLNAGMVVIRDIQSRTIVAQFQSQKTALACIEFNPSGSLIATASVDGQTIHVHRIKPSKPWENDSPTSQGDQPQYTQNLLYKLERGITHAQICSLSFSNDLRWLGVTSARGTTHIFPISTSGGPINVFSHPIVEFSSQNDKTNTSESNTDPSKWNTVAEASVEAVSAAMGKLKSRFARRKSSLDDDISLQSDDVLFEFTEDMEDYTSRSSSPGDMSLLDLSQERFHQANSASQEHHREATISNPIQEVTTNGFSSAPAYLEALHSDATVTLSALKRVRHSMTPVAPFVSKNNTNIPDDTNQLQLSQNDFPCCENLVAAIATKFVGNKIISVSRNGVMNCHELIPRRYGDIHPKDKIHQNQLALEVVPTRNWDICRRHSWPECQEFSAKSNFSLLKKLNEPNDANEEQVYADMLSNIELITHAKPVVPLWTIPHFKYCTYDGDSPPSKNPLSTGKIIGTPVEIRGLGPAPVVPVNSTMNGNLCSSKQPILQDLKLAMETPVNFDHALGVKTTTKVLNQQNKQTDQQIVQQKLIPSKQAKKKVNKKKKIS